MDGLYWVARFPGAKTRYFKTFDEAVSYRKQMEFEHGDYRHSRETHGMRYHQFYYVWSNMIARCENPNNRKYRIYGAAGRSIYPEWHDPRVFIEYLEKNLGDCPDGMSLDRIDNNKGYEPGNLRWATSVEQRRNSNRDK